MHFSGWVDRDGCETYDLIRLYFGLRHQRGRNSAVVVEIEELGQELVLMSLDCLIEVLPQVQLEDKGFLLAKDGHQDVLDADLQLSGVHVAEVLLEPLEPKIVLLGHI